MTMKNAGIDIHVHPFLDRNSLSDVVGAMYSSRLDVVALESFNETLYPKMIEMSRSEGLAADVDRGGIRLRDGKYLLNAREYDTKERIHVITVGHSMEAGKDAEIRSIIDDGLKSEALVVLDHPYVDNEFTRTAGHIPYEKEKLLEELCREYSGNIAVEWNSYCVPWMRWGLKQALNMGGHGVEYHDVNRMAEMLSYGMHMAGNNVPIIADTDLHGRNRRFLKLMGTSRIVMDVEGETATDVVKSIKQGVFSGNYRNVKRYVPSTHLLEAFCLPILFPNHFWKPRA